ncbi:zinc finger BED domain-containing protein RICESLEEPER 2-like [Arachis stenosperma]|uniref:zinc finger BED domain-containing protein RICESLEEPER 2-like n=1 Tax=Arachis stenosperma TaxID=217475 RepID=UPI0025ACCEFB|nr:zinc finger BED domain-containing protein RICESLEEPER 2-like [Arachis stenosperma]
MPPPHTEFDLSSKIFELLNEWRIEKKIMTLTLDNASANDTCQDHLKSTLNMHDWLLCDGKFFHIRYLAHILNLIVQDGLKIAHDALDKIRKSVKYIRGSESRMIRFKECVSAIHGLNFTSGLHLDVTTQWNSTYIMLESAIKYRKAFEYLKATNHAYKYCPSVDEWGRAERICEFLFPFYETTNLISGTSYPTLNLYFLKVYHIQCVLMGSLRSEDKLLKSMGEKTMNKFKKYWKKYSVILAFGAILDFRFKISTLELMYEEIDAETAKGKVEYVKKKLYKFFKKYDKNSLPIVEAHGHSIQSSSMAHTPESASKKRLAIIGKLMKRNHQAEVSSGKNPLDTYLEEPLLSKNCFEDLDVLEL